MDAEFAVYTSSALIGCALAMDAAAVTMTAGIQAHRLKVADIIKMAVVFGAFQGIMPIIGWFAGYRMHKIFMDFDHWIAFFLLAILGSKIIYDSITREGHELPIISTCWKMLIGLGLATSIDALVVGLSFAFSAQPIFKSAVIIGVVTFIICVIAAAFGDRLPKYSPTKVNFIAGCILIFIGLKTLIDHTLFQ